MGYIEETGVAQLLRDSRIAPIYEGTNGIQALDLVRRKLSLDGGVHRYRVFGDMPRELADGSSNAEPRDIVTPAQDALGLLEEATDWILRQQSNDAAAAATPYLRLFALVLGAYLLSKEAPFANAYPENDRCERSFLQAKIDTCHFYVTDILPQAHDLHRTVVGTSLSLLAAVPIDQHLL